MGITYKLKGGKFVKAERTPEQQQQYDEYFAAADNPKLAADERFIGCPVWWLRRVLPVIKGTHQLVVALYLWRRQVVCGNSGTFDVPNGELKSWGILRKTKYQTLDRLAAANIIRVNREGKKALTVTILLKKPKGE